MSDRSRGGFLVFAFGCGIVGCLTGGFVLYLFTSALIDANALQSAPICSAPTRAATSRCLGILHGQITFEGLAGKNNERVTIALEDTNVDARYQCDESPPGACSSLTLRAGIPVATGWWKGQMVAFGPPGSRPSIVTESNPVDLADHVSFFLVLVILGVSGVVAGLLVVQAPSSLDDLVRSVTASQPKPPRNVDLRLLWRVAIGYSAWGGYAAWAGLFIVTYAVAGRTNPGVAAILLVATAIISIGPAMLLAPVGLRRTLRSAERRTVTVKRFQTLTARGRTSTTVWYDRADGREGSTDLGEDWTDEVQIGEQLDALVDPKTGAVERVLSEPPD